MSDWKLNRADCMSDKGLNWAVWVDSRSALGVSAHHDARVKKKRLSTDIVVLAKLLQCFGRQF
jgi:hypothetical protein